MIQLCILSGRMAGDTPVVRHFPFRIGRAPGNDLCLDEAGFLHTAPDAFVAINEQPQTSARLRNGDILSFGSAKIQFWLAAPRQRGLHWSEVFFWTLLAAVTGFQFFLIFRFLK
jgi:hypothetical protein